MFDRAMWRHFQELNWLCPQNGPDATGRGWTRVDTAGTKNPVGTGFSALLWIRLDPDLVEAAGV